MNIEKMLTAEMPDSMVGKVVTSFDTQVSDPDVNVASYGLTKQLNDNLTEYQTIPKTISISANGYATVDLDYTIPTGKSIVGIFVDSPDNGAIPFIQLVDNAYKLTVRNVTSYPLNNKVFNVHFVYGKS